MGLCQSELAQKLGVSFSEIRAWELGEVLPSTNHAQALDFLFRQNESSVLEILQAPQAENILASNVLESVNLRDLVHDNMTVKAR